jgi:basic membrane protein A and related proteins
VSALLVLGLALSACGTDADGVAGDGELSVEDLQVAFVYDGSVDDGAWNSSHDAGREYLEEHMTGLEVTTLEEIQPGDQARATFEDLATQGYDLIVATTFYQDDALAVASDFPEAKFITWGGFEVAENVGHYELATEDGRYLDGIVAGSMTEANIVGYPAGFPIEEVVRGINAFVRGMHEVNPDATVVPVWMNSWFDPPREREASEALVDAGADILVHELNSPAMASVAQRRGIYHMGYAWDQSGWSEGTPESWLGSFTFDWGPYYVEQVQAILDGTWTAERYYGTLQDGVIGLASFGPDVPEDVIALVEERKQEIADGTFDVFEGPIYDNEGNLVVAEGETIPVGERTACCDWLIDGVDGSIDG